MSFDQALVFHGVTDYMRDYEVFIYATADPRTGIGQSTCGLFQILCAREHHVGGAALGLGPVTASARCSPPPPPPGHPLAHSPSQPQHAM